MNNFSSYITPEQAADFAIENGDKTPRDKLVQHFIDLAKGNSKCMNCDEEAWKYTGTGLCFSCTTGEADASEDYELEIP